MLAALWAPASLGMPSVARTLSTAKTVPATKGNASNSRKRQQMLSRDSRTALAWNPATAGTPKTTAEALFPARIVLMETAQDTNNSRHARNSQEASNSGDTTSMIGAGNHRVASNR